MFGVPHLLLPDDEAFEDLTAAEDNHKMLAALCQVCRLQPDLVRYSMLLACIKGHADLWL